MDGKAVVVGGGASGMMTALFLSERGIGVDLIEKNEKLGKKIFITGKGRCNFTNACEDQIFFDSVIRNSRFLYSAYSRFDNRSVMDLFNELGLEYKIERGNRVFPVSDKAYEVTDVLKRRLKRNGVRIHLNTEATGLGVKDGKVEYVSVRKASGETEDIPADRIIIATGGMSYASTGSTGDGYRFAKEAGIKVNPLSPSLTGVHITKEGFAIPAGLTLKNVSLSVIDEKGKKLFSDFGEMLFTHDGLSGPLILKATAVAGDKRDIAGCKCVIDLKPAVSEDTFDERLKRLVSEMPKKSISNMLKGVYPQALIPVILFKAGLDGDLKAAELTRAGRASLLKNTKGLTFVIEKSGGFNEAVITKGGIDVKELDPRTMESRKIKGLYFTGEVIDVDALTGGFNLQIAWSTAHAAGTA